MQNTTNSMGTPIPWDNVFMSITDVISTRSKDPNTRCGAVIVDPNKLPKNAIVAVGFNGPPPQIKDDLVDWSRPGKYNYILHAEDNAIWFGLEARGQAGLIGCTLYVNGFPCPRCMLRIVRAGIERVVYGSLVPKCSEDMELTKHLAGLAYVKLEEFK